MVTEQSDTYVVNLDNLIEEITKNTYEMILNVGYLKLNEKTSIPIFDMVENIIEEADNNKITLEDGWTVIPSLIKHKEELTKTTKIKFNISLYGVKETSKLRTKRKY